MTTTTLYSSKKLIFAAYKNAMIRLKGIGAFYFALSIVSFPVMYFLELNSAQSNKQVIALRGEVVYNFIANNIYPPFTCLAYFALLIGMTVLSGVMVNGYMHHKKAVDVYHSLPITRAQALLANYLAAASTIILPIIICFGLVTIGNATTQATTFPVIMIEMLHLIVTVLALLSITFFCCVLCCAGFDSAAFTLSLGIIVPCFFFLREMTFETMLFGYASNNGALSAVKLSPVLMFYSSFISTFFGIGNRELLMPETLYIGYFAFAIGLLLVACIIYTNRKSELAQSFNTKGVIYQFLISAASFGCAVMISVFTCYTMGQNANRDFRDNKLMIVCLSFIFGAILYFAFNTILTRSFKQTKRSLVTLSICAIAPAAYLSFLLFTGWFGYDVYVPKLESIAQVNIDYAGTYNQIGYNDIEEAYASPHTITTLKSESSIQTVMDIHSEIVNGERRHDGGETQVYLNVIYRLKNGKTLSRFLSCTLESKTVEKLVNLESEAEFKAQHSPYLLSSAEDVRTFEIKDGFGKNLVTLNLTKEEIAVLYKAMQLDDANQSLQGKITSTGMPFCKISVLYKNVQSDAGNKQIDRPMFTNVSMDVTSQSYNTIKALNDLKLERYTTITIPENTVAIITPAAKNANVYYSSNDMLYRTGGFRQTGFATNAVYGMMDFPAKEYTNKENQLEEILPMLQNYAYKGKGTVFQVLLVNEDLAEEYLENSKDFHQVAEGTELGYYLMAYGSAPQFIRDDFDSLLAEYEATGMASSLQ